LTTTTQNITDTSTDQPSWNSLSHL
jgi:hypothetical protein